MIKKIFILLFLLVLMAYLVVAVTLLNATPVQQTCQGLELVINDSIDHGFITKQEILKNKTKRKMAIKVPAFAIRGQVTGRNPFATNIGTIYGLKNCDKVAIYRTKEKNVPFDYSLYQIHYLFLFRPKKGIPQSLRHILLPTLPAENLSSLGILA